jgi:hypothetical protein
MESVPANSSPEVDPMKIASTPLPGGRTLK